MHGLRRRLLVQNGLDPSRATEIFSVPKRRIFALSKIVRYRNNCGLQYTEMPTAGCAWRFFIFFLFIYIFQRNLTKWWKERRKSELRIWDQEMKERRRKRKEEKKEGGHTYTHKHQNSWGFTKSPRSARLPRDLVRQFANRQRSHRPSPVAQRDSLAPVIFSFFFFSFLPHWNGEFFSLPKIVRYRNKSGSQYNLGGNADLTGAGHRRFFSFFFFSNACVTFVTIVSL